MELPKKERTFYFDFTSQETGQKYDGTFTIKCRLSIAEKYNYELEKSRLLADQANPTNGLFNIATAISFLKARIANGPQWWLQSNGFDLEDEEVLYLLMEKTNSEIKAWKEELVKIAKPEVSDLGK